MLSVTCKNVQVAGKRSSKTSQTGSIIPPENATDAELEACFSLIERTSGADYAASATGWKPAAKRAEMREPDMRFLLVRKQEPDQGTNSSQESTARDAEKTTKGTETTTRPTKPFLFKDTTILGFMSFMITVEEGQDVVYVYEIHLEEELRGLGLGKHLFNIVEHIGTTNGMEKTMLTVFRRNEQARAMYGKLGYDVDECSPRPRRLRGGVVKEADYIIMSKVLQPEIQPVDLQLQGGRRKKMKTLDGSAKP